MYGIWRQLRLETPPKFLDGQWVDVHYPEENRLILLDRVLGFTAEQRALAIKINVDGQTQSLSFANLSISFFGIVGYD